MPPRVRNSVVKYGKTVCWLVERRFAQGYVSSYPPKGFVVLLCRATGGSLIRDHKGPILNEWDQPPHTITFGYEAYISNMCKFG